ncbi:glycosyl hydrolase 115 family protein [Butyrivibrio sp.]|uniref:glycosyl hydrolase 115 family protein n=1 Tax=Butyrivibrio sp. TaxID=28121 RepID=UPI0025EF7571|nr:glycosyl hydrolase 115 family protein [Butyrivibrio sp.]
MNTIKINSNTKIIYQDEKVPVLKAIAALRRDIANTCSKTEDKGLDIVLKHVNYNDENKGYNNINSNDESKCYNNINNKIDIESSVPCDKNNYESMLNTHSIRECFTIKAEQVEDQNCLVIEAAGDLGFIYGIYHISRTFLGVQNFWFWNEQFFSKKSYYEVPTDYKYESVKPVVALRGWFINDEILFDEWKPEGSECLPWEMAFEALLRCGGNMTIPGTDHNSHKYKALARDYGLWITHHHAEPLGAEMFARAYPDLEASFAKYPELFRGLWKKAIQDQKDCNVVWNLGFRGQGDRPFWADDPSYDTPLARGRLMSDLIMEQYNLVKEADPDAICCTNLYGETMELYRDGYLDLPEDVIKIWADNGFGKMVSRRQNNHNPRVYALPKEDDKGSHGIYYHASFYDLQAAAQMTMLPNSPEFVVNELMDVMAHGADDFWIINCSNVKMHTYYLDLIAKLWLGERLEESLQIADNHRKAFCLDYYGEKLYKTAAELYSLWPKYSVSYGPNEDDHAGEQFSNHGTRILVSAFISNFNRFSPGTTKADPSLEWICPADHLVSQVKFYLEKFEQGTRNYQEYLKRCQDEIGRVLKDSEETCKESEGTLKKDSLMILNNCEQDNSIENNLNLKYNCKALQDNLVYQVEYMYYSNLGALHACKALMYCLDNSISESFFDALEESGEDETADYLSAFYEAGLAFKAFDQGYKLMRGHEHGIWKNFYKNDCEADIRQSSILMQGLMSYLRVLGDGPHFYKWQRRFQQGAGGDRIHLILRLKAHITDEELWNLMDQNR